MKKFILRSLILAVGMLAGMQAVNAYTVDEILADGQYIQ